MRGLLLVAGVLVSLLAVAPVSAGPRSDALAMTGITMAIPDALSDGALVTDFTVPAASRVTITGTDLTLVVARVPKPAAMRHGAYPTADTRALIAAAGGTEITGLPPGSNDPQPYTGNTAGSVFAVRYTLPNEPARYDFDCVAMTFVYEAPDFSFLTVTFLGEAHTVSTAAHDAFPTIALVP